MNLQKKYNPPVSQGQNGIEKEVKNGVALTKREQEVLEWTVEGLTAREIAKKAFVSLHTVETHKRNIIQKLEAKNTAHAIVKAMRMGLIE